MHTLQFELAIYMSVRLVNLYAFILHVCAVHIIRTICSVPFSHFGHAVIIIEKISPSLKHFTYTVDTILVFVYIL